MKWQKIDEYAVQPSKFPNYSLVCLALQTPNEKVDEVMKLITGDKVEITIQKKREKRSLTANSYMWVICDELGKVLGASKEEVYRNAIRQVGAYQVMAVKPFAYESFTKIWESRGVGWIVEIESKSKTFYTIRTYIGSSAYDKKQMARLIDWLIQEAVEQGINVLPQDKRSELIKNWEGEINDYEGT